MKRLLLISMVFAIIVAGCKKDKPATLASITTTAVSGVTANTAVTGGNITSDGGAGVTRRGVCWATHTNPTVADSITNDGTGPGSFTSNLAGLSANVTYYVKAYAINGAGTAYGNEVSFTTSQGLATITTTAITNNIALSASSGGNVISDGGFPVTARGVVWATSAHPTIANFKTTNGAGTGVFTSTLTPLASQTVYYVRAYATTSFGTAYGNEITLTAASSNSVADIDGNVYGTITIGTQTWMTSNLKVTRYRNGDPITNGLTGFDFNTHVGAYTFPNGDIGNDAVYGKLYNIWAVNDPRNIAPTGWHVPSDAEWKTLEIFEGMSQADADAINNRGTIGPLLMEGGSSGLNLQKAGFLFVGFGYLSFNTSGYFSTSTNIASLNSNWFRAVNPSPSAPTAVQRQNGSHVVSVRCIKDYSIIINSTPSLIKINIKEGVT